MIPRGFYSGRGPWWLVGWQGKIFYCDGTGYNLFRILGKDKWNLRFTWTECAGTVYIKYDKHGRFRDVIVQDGDGWQGKIYVLGIKVGTFELRK